MVVAQGSTKALTTFDWPDGGTLQYLGCDQSITETLVISLTVVVLNILLATSRSGAESPGFCGITSLFPRCTECIDDQC